MNPIFIHLQKQDKIKVYKKATAEKLRKKKKIKISYQKTL